MLVLNPAERAPLPELLAHDFLRQEVPKALPLSTLACPPSRQFLDALLRSEHKCGPSQSSRDQPNSHKDQPNSHKDQSRPPKEDDHEHTVNSSRTSKYSQKPLCLVANEQLQLHPPRAQKSERSQGSLPRNSTSGALLTRKTTISSSTPLPGSPLLVSFFEEQAKYGMFYVLANGAMGMRFNDQTCLVSNSKFSRFRYCALQGDRENVVFAAG
jgi:polo-like kinase 1